MGLLSYIDRKLQSMGYVKANRVQEAFTPTGYDKTGYPVPDDTADYQKVYSNATWVYAAANAIGRAAAGLPYVIMRPGKNGVNEPVPGHWLQKLFDAVNPFMTSYELNEAVFINLMLTGNAYIGIERNASGRAVELWPLNSSRVTVIPSKSEYVKGYLYTVNGRDVAYEPKDIIHIKLFDPNNDYYGLSPIAAASLAVQSDLYAARYNRNIFKNESLPGVYLKSDQVLDGDTAEEIRKRWDRSHKGVDKAGRTAVLGSGTEAKTLNVSNRDMQYMEQRKMSREEILAVMGVPPVMVGLLEYASYANAREQKATFWEDTMTPLLTKVGATINEQLVQKEDPSVVGMYDLSGVKALQENRKEQTEIVSSLVGSGMPLNDALKFAGIEGKEYAWGNIAWLPFNLMPVSSATDPTTEEDTEGKQGRPFVRRFTKAQRDNSIRQRRKRLAPIHDRMKRKMLRLYQEQENAILRIIRAVDEKAVKLPPPEAMRQMLDDIEEELKRGRKEFEQGALAYIIQALEQGVEHVNTDLQIDFTLSNERAKKLIQTQASRFAKDVTETTKTDLLAALREGIDAGESSKELYDRAKQYYDTSKDYRAENAARTETARAYSTANMEGYKEAGFTKHEWIKDTERHAENESVGAIPIGDTFPSGSTMPGDECNCGCDTVPAE